MNIRQQDSFPKFILSFRDGKECQWNVSPNEFGNVHMVLDCRLNDPTYNHRMKLRITENNIYSLNNGTVGQMRNAWYLLIRKGFRIL
jgi:hypothetical protein